MTEELIESTVDKIEQYATIRDFTQVGNCVREAIDAATAKLQKECDDHARGEKEYCDAYQRSVEKTAKLRAELVEWRKEAEGMLSEAQAEIAKLREALRRMPELAYEAMHTPQSAIKIENLPNELQCIADAALSPAEPGQPKEQQQSKH